MAPSRLITIDGVAGSGKGTLSRRLAAHYHWAFLDTGLIYRALAARALDLKLALDDADSLKSLAAQLVPQDWEDESKLRTEAVGKIASVLGAMPHVRSQLLACQRSFADHPPQGFDGAILDGRDIGTTICPHAPLKFFLTASPKIRAERRLKELQEKQIFSTYEEVLHDMQERDQRDQTRSVAPLNPAKDAIVIDTSHLDVDAVFHLATHHADRFFFPTLS